MISELIVTSAPRGLQAGRSGFTTVCRTRGIHPDLASRLEAASAYRHVFPQGDTRNPVIFSYTTRPSSLGDVWVMSRVADAGTDYTGRSNKIAHHIALQQSDISGLAASNPAAVMAALAARGGLLTRWEGEPRENALPPQLPLPPTEPEPCRRWTSIAGDGGWAGVLVERGLRKEATWIIVPPATDVLALFSEALALVSPSQRWQIPFTTYSLRGDEGRWLAAIAGSSEAEAALAQKRIPVIDLTCRSNVTSSSPYVSAARGQSPVPWQRAATAPPPHSANGNAPLPPRGMPAPPTTSDPDVRSPQGLPPALNRSRSIHGAAPPDLAEWEEVELSCPQSGRFALLFAVSAVIVVAAVMCAFMSYYCEWLPKNWIRRIDERAWASGLPVEPEAVKQAKSASDGLNKCLADLNAQQLLGELEATHPSLHKMLFDAQSRLSRLNALLAKKQQAPLADLAQAHTATADSLKDLSPFANDKELLAAHVASAKVLREINDEQTASIKGLPEAIRELADALKTHASKDTLLTHTIAVTELSKKPKAPQPDNSAAADSGNLSTAKQTEGQPESRSDERQSVMQLLADAAGDKHLPESGVQSLKQNEQVTLLRFTKPASLKSVQSVSLRLPAPKGDKGFLLETTGTSAASQPRTWKCSDTSQKTTLGTFRLSQNELTFASEVSTAQLLASGLPFMPLVITGEQGTAWVQLVTKHSPKQCLEIPNGKSTGVPLSFVSEPGSEVSSMKRLVQQRLEWKKLTASAISGTTELLLATKAAPGFRAQVSIDCGFSPRGLTLYWCPSILQMYDNKPSAYYETLTLEFLLNASDNNPLSALGIKPTFEVDDFLGESGSQEAYDRLYRAHHKKKLGEDDWLGVRSLVTQDCIQIDSPDWPDTSKGRADLLKSVVRGASTNRQQQHLWDWINDLQTLVKERHSFDKYVRDQIKAAKGPAPERPQELPPQGATEKDADFQARKKERDLLFSRWSRYETEVQSQKDNPWVLRMWGEEDLLPSKAGTLEDKLLFALWRRLHQYRVVTANGLCFNAKEDDDTKGRQSLRQLADAAQLRLSGELVIRWSDSDFTPPLSDGPFDVVLSTIPGCQPGNR